MLPNGIKYRYEFLKVVEDGVPCLEIRDTYLEPTVECKFVLKFDNKGVTELNGYGHSTIDLLLDFLSGRNPSLNSRDFIAMKDSMSRVKYILEDLGDAMERYDHVTGSKSQFHFESIPIKGDVFTSDVKNNLIQQNKNVCQ